MTARRAIATIALSAAGLVGIAQYEGYSDRAITPVAGDVPTLGFGTTEGVKLGDTITPPQALVRALQDAQRYEGALRRCVRVPLHQHEYDAYLSLAYNIGPSAFCSSKLVKLLNQEDYLGGCTQILRWDKFKGATLRGLTERRRSEFKRCMGQEAG